MFNLFRYRIHRHDIIRYKSKKIFRRKLYHQKQTSTVQVDAVTRESNM